MPAVLRSNVADPDDAELACATRVYRGDFIPVAWSQISTRRVGAEAAR